MKTYFIMLTGLLCALISGCSKDKGNYDLVPINEIKIKDDAPENIKVFQFGNIQINANLEQTKGLDENKLIYSWTTYLIANPPTSYVLGTSKNLNARVDVKPGKYTILYQVKDPTTGVSFFKEYSMEVSTRLGEGWMALQDMPNGKQEISMINVGEEVLHNLYGNANKDQSLPSGCYAIKVLNTVYGVQNVFILAKENAVEVDFISLKKFDEFKTWFYTPPTNINIQNYAYGRLGGSAFIVNNNELYSLSFLNGGDKLKFGVPIKGDWKISEYIFPHTYSDYTLVYDTKNQRFLRHIGAAISTLSNAPGSAFDPNNVGKQLVFGGPGSGDFYNCLLKNNNDDQYFMYRVNAANTATVIAAEKYQITDAPELNSAKLFASSGLYLHMYYAVGNKIYLLDIPAQKSRLVYTFPAGAEITAMKLKQSTNLIVFYPDNNKQLTAAIYQNGEGKVYKFSISNTGDFTGNTYTKEYTGFNRVKDLEYKNGSAY